MKNKFILLGVMLLFGIVFVSGLIIYTSDTFATITSSINDSTPGMSGGRIAPKYDFNISNFTIDIAGVIPVTNCYIFNASNGSYIANVTPVGALVTFTNKPTLYRGFNYIVGCNGNGATYTKRYEVSNTYPQQKTTYNVSGGCNGCVTNSTSPYVFPQTSDVLAQITNIGTEVIVNVIMYNNLSYETATENYISKITSPATPTNAFLVYNGTSYTATVTSNGFNYYTLSNNLQIDSSRIGTNTFYYRWNISSTISDNTTNYTQYIEPILLGYCNATLLFPYLNFTFKDETTDTNINGTIATSTFIYYLGNGTTSKSYSYSQATAQSNYTFCGLPANKTYNIDSYIQYGAGTSYTPKTYNPEVISYTNYTNITLYLLGVGLESPVTFQVINVAEQSLSGVLVELVRINSATENQSIGIGTTDSAGAVTFDLSSDYTHQITFTKEGYTTYVVTLQPTQSLYTITMASETTTTDNDYSKGISYKIKPTGDFIQNNSIYNFNMTLSSSFWTIEKFGFSLYWNNGTLIGETSSDETGFINLDANTTNQSRIRMNYYYLINETFTNYTKLWLVESGGDKRSFSIWHFFQDLKLYTDSGDGLWGFDDFGRALLSFVILVLVTGGLFYRYGIVNEAVIMGLIFGVVFLLDYGVGLIPNPDIGVNHFISILVLLVAVVFLVKEEIK